VVFTLPQLVAPLALQNQQLIYGLLFRAAAETLLQIAADPRHLGARIGFLAVLHTWGQNLHHHPHFHCVVPGGGIACDRRRWISCRRQFLFPVKVLSRLFRGKFIAYLKTAFRDGELGFHGELKWLGEKRKFIEWLHGAAATEWVVYAKPPFGGPRQVLKYLARYTHRVAISNQRLVAVEDGRVTFRWKNSARAGEPATMTLKAEEFIRRFLLHVLPRGFVKLRHFGFLAKPLALGGTPDAHCPRCEQFEPSTRGGIVSWDESVERKLTAILCADVYGYTRLIGENEEATLRTLSLHRKLIDSLIAQHHGRFVNSAGDSVLAEFASVVNAVQCAVDIQTTLKAENANMSPDRQMEFRIGVNLGDVMVDGEQIYGDGVNVAARLESLADPGGICISHTVHDQIKNKLALNYEGLGPQAVKNIAEPVRVFRVILEGGTPTRTAAKAKERSLRKHWRGGVFSLAGLALIAAVIVFVQHLSLRPPTPSASIPPPQPPALPLPDKPSIAVLPFTNMGGEREQEYFSDGITDDIITALSRLPDLFVIARASTFTYKGKAAKVQDVGRELGVAYVLEGSVQRADGQVRITAQLDDATAGAELWAERYDRPMRDIFTLQDEIVRRIVTSLKVQVVQTTDLLTKQPHTDSPEAYDDYLRGLYLVLGSMGAGPTKEGNLQARRMLEKAVQLDPKYADAYVGLGWTYRMEWAWRWNSDPHMLELSFQLAHEAIALDDSLAEAHDLLAVDCAAKRLFDQSVSEAERAVTLAPNSAAAYNLLAWVLGFAVQPAAQLAAAEKAMRLDPRDDLPLLSIGTAYTEMGRYREAIPSLKRYQASHPNNLGAPLLLAIDYIELLMLE
jgi:adenylate cyclase